jgi:hypothetical protein
MFLLALALITFETVSMGLERASALRQINYNRLATKIEALQTEQESRKTEIQQLRTNDSVTRAQADLDSLQASAQRERDDLQSRLNDIDGQLAGDRALSPQAVNAQEQVLQLKKERAERVAQQQAEMNSAVQQFERQRDSFAERAKEARDSGDVVAAKNLEEQLSRLTNPRLRLEKRHQEETAPIDAEIQVATARVRELSKTSAKLTESAKSRLQSQRDVLLAKLATQEEKYDRLIAEATERLANAQRAVATRDSTISSNEERIVQINDELRALKTERIEAARTDQVRRLASRIYGKPPEEITEEEQNWVALIWFGSLAALAALAGPLTALVALGLQRIADDKDVQPSQGKLSRLIRRLLLSWRWRRVKKIPVRIEVPVEKEVEKRVEVPVEKVIQEILYIPILTDDPDAVKRVLSQDLPAEVSELVRVSTKSRARADAP